MSWNLRFPDTPVLSIVRYIGVYFIMWNLTIRPLPRTSGGVIARLLTSNSNRPFVGYNTIGPKQQRMSGEILDDNGSEMAARIAAESETAQQQMIDAERSFEGDVLAYYDSIPVDDRGFGWFDDRLRDFHSGIDLTAIATFRSVPRPFDRNPMTVPAYHPLRAIAKVMAEAQIGSIIRISAYSLTDPLALDLITHHGNDKVVNVILHPIDYTAQQIKQFLEKHQRIFSHRVFVSQVNVRVANVHGVGCSRYTQMHEKHILTSTHSVYGSYNLSCASRCANWESVRISSAVEEEEVLAFDRHWDALESRKLQAVYTEIFPAGFRMDDRKRARLES